MKENKRSTVYYVCYYAEPDFSNDIVSYPSVWSKIDYVSDTIKKNGFDVCYVCPVMPYNGKFKKRIIQIDRNERHVYFSAYRNKRLRIVNIVNALAQNFQILSYLLLHVRRDDHVLIYHSMFHVRWAGILRRIFGKQYYLQIEDVYSALSPDGVRFEAKEWEFFESAKGYLCVNSLIKDRIKNPAPKIISHGRYVVPDILEQFCSNKCRLVYAGVIEQVRKGAFLAADAMKYLPDQYELVILGFGKEEDISELETVIEQINLDKGWNCIRYLGYLSGEPYLRELQQCRIALSTHMYDESNMKSADYTFPSKLLVYLGNGLHVVAQDLKCLRTSMIDQYITYYDKATPEAVAAAIRSIDFSIDYDSRKCIRDLNAEFRKSMVALFR